MSAPRWTRCAAAAAAEEIAEKSLAEDVAEGGEDVGNVVEVRRIAARQTGMTVAIVPGPLFRMAEDFEGLGRLFEPAHGLIIARVAVGMVAERQLPIGLGDLGLARRCDPRPGLRSSRVFPPSLPWPGWRPTPEYSILPRTRRRSSIEPAYPQRTDFRPSSARRARRLNDVTPAKQPATPWEVAR